MIWQKPLDRAAFVVKLRDEDIFFGVVDGVRECRVGANEAGGHPFGFCVV
jgi:hypothetical protein